jgi:hypothetical protein
VTQINTRRVHYFSGFDPRGAGHYHRLCTEQAAKLAPQDGVLAVGKRRRQGKLFYVWPVQWHNKAGNQAVHTEHVFMSWDDLIRQNWSKTPLALVKEFWLAYRGIVFEVNLRKVRELFHGVFLTGVLPGAYLIGALLLGGAVAGLVRLLVGMAADNSPVWSSAGWAVGMLLGTLAVWRAGQYGAQRGLFWLLRIFTYVVRMGRAEVDGLEQRTALWVEEVIKRQQDNPVDEVVLVGHSVGTLMMVGAVDALLQDPRWQALQQGRATNMLTLGQCYPFVAMVNRPFAQRFVAALARLSFSNQLNWLDVTAKIDPLCFHMAHPLAKTGINHQQAPMPVLRAASFFKMYTTATWQTIRDNKLEAHFLYLHTPELPGNFNLYTLLYGPSGFAQHTAQPSRASSQAD